MAHVVPPSVAWVRVGLVALNLRVFRRLDDGFEAGEICIHIIFEGYRWLVDGWYRNAIYRYNLYCINVNVLVSANNSRRVKTITCSTVQKSPAVSAKKTKSHLICMWSKDLAASVLPLSCWDSFPQSFEGCKGARHLQNRGYPRWQTLSVDWLMQWKLWLSRRLLKLMIEIGDMIFPIRPKKYCHIF